MTTVTAIVNEIKTIKVGKPNSIYSKLECEHLIPVLEVIIKLFGL